MVSDNDDEQGTSDDNYDNGTDSSEYSSGESDSDEGRRLRNARGLYQAEITSKLHFVSQT